MRILHVGKYYAPYRGGMETVLENLVEGLLASGQEVSVLVAGQEATTRRQWLEGQVSRASLLRLGNLGVVNSQPVTPDLPVALRREIHRFQPDLVHLHLPNPLLAATWLGLTGWSPSAAGPPLAVWHHADITRQKLGRRLAGPFVRACLQRAAGISVSSSALLDQSLDLVPFRQKARVIPFGLDPDPWQDINSDGTGPFLFVGRLVPYKGLDILLQAVTRVPEARLVLVGEGPLAASLQASIDSLRIADRVQLAGDLPRTRLVEIMGTARALILPSLDTSETFGLVQLEAMAAGLPVVASDLPTGVRQVGLADQSCLLVAPGDVQMLAEAMERLQKDTALCRELGDSGRRRFLEKFTRQHMIDNLLDWYGQLTAPATKV